MAARLGLLAWGDATTREVSSGLAEATGGAGAGAGAPLAKRTRWELPSAASPSSVLGGNEADWSMLLGARAVAGGRTTDDAHERLAVAALSSVSTASPFTSLDDSVRGSFQATQEAGGGGGAPSSPSALINARGAMAAGAYTRVASASPTGYMRVILDGGDGRASAASPSAPATHVAAPPSPPLGVPRTSSNTIRLGGGSNGSGGGNGGGGGISTRPSPLSARSPVAVGGGVAGASEPSGSQTGASR
mgnify:CR=1 FL=1